MVLYAFTHPLFYILLSSHSDFYFFLIAGSESLLQLHFEGNYEAILLSEVIQDVFTTLTMTEEKMDTYLEKLIVAYLDCSAADADNMER